MSKCVKCLQLWRLKIINLIKLIVPLTYESIFPNLWCTVSVNTTYTVSTFSSKVRFFRTNVRRDFLVGFLRCTRTLRISWNPIPTPTPCFLQLGVWLVDEYFSGLYFSVLLLLNDLGSLMNKVLISFISGYPSLFSSSFLLAVHSSN